VSFPHDVHADTWAATDALGRSLPGHAECGGPRPDRFAGIFYFICHAQRSPRLPLNVSEIIAANPENPAFVPNAGHYWGEPEPGYYLSTDRWVIRRHAYQLADAGIDTLIFDTTNDVTYPEAYEAVCEVFTQIRAEGEPTPQICFLASEQSITRSGTTFIAKGRFADLWFQWKGKPLLLFGQWEKRGQMPDVRLPQHITDFFTIRQSWAWDSLPWYGEDGYHRWPWVAHTPQCIGWDQPGEAEMVPVAIGQHPISNIGRSFPQRAAAARQPIRRNRIYPPRAAFCRAVAARAGSRPAVYLYHRVERVGRRFRRVRRPFTTSPPGAVGFLPRRKAGAGRART
jgi:hypothetical protein